jgi:hypothetical protein
MVVRDHKDFRGVKVVKVGWVILVISVNREQLDFRVGMD